MRYFIAALLYTLAFAKPNNDLNRSEDFSKETFNPIIEVKDLNEENATELAIEKAQIKEQNETFDEGLSTFNERLYEFLDLAQDEFENEKTGLTKRRAIKRATGLIETPEWDKVQTPEIQAFLDSLYSKYNRQATLLPPEYSAVSEGLVTSVKNQGSCNSCTAFTATASHETCMIKAGAEAQDLDLSEQQLLDCAFGQPGANGCNPSGIDSYQRWMVDQNGLVNHELNYPYIARRNNVCQNVPFWSPGAKVTNVYWDYACNDIRMMIFVHAFGSVTAGIASRDLKFRNYRSGILQGCTSNVTSHDHTVSVCGYGTENGIDYWLVKNSWGPFWGENGYFRIRRGNNECAIEDRCVVTDCVADGARDPLPKSAPKPTNQIKCDMTKCIGAGVTGSFRLTSTNLNTISGPSQIVSKVTCINSICHEFENVPFQPDCCAYICGTALCCP